MLLAWHQAQKVASAKKAGKVIQRQNIVAGREAPPLFARWINDDKERLLGLMSDSVDVSDTHYGQEAALKIRELEAVVDSMSQEKRNKLQRKLNEHDMHNNIQAIKVEQTQVTVSKDSETGAIYIPFKCYCNTHLTV